MRKKVLLSSQDVEVLLEEPTGEIVELDVVGCHLESCGRFLLLKRAPDKSEGSRWGVPAGKVEKGETLVAAMARELFEETGIEASQEELQRLGHLVIRKSSKHFRHYLFRYHLFRLCRSKQPQVIINEEHTEYRWVNDEEASRLPLMIAAPEAFSYYKKFLLQRSDALVDKDIGSAKDNMEKRN